MRHRFVLFALLLPAIAACSSDNANDVSSAVAETTQTTVMADSAPTADSAPAAAATTTTVVVAAATPQAAQAVGITDFKFVPETINVPVGGSVVWTNNDAQQHTATSAGGFDAGAIQPNSTATVEFETAGTFAYICSFHPFMIGTVVVG